MGRYYSGDIEGKFWFGVQKSNDASFFGGEETEPQEINYLFTREDDLAKVKTGIAKCKKMLGKYHKPMDKFFQVNNGYNDGMLVKALKLEEGESITSLLEWYARLELGKKILACLEEQDTCEFDAEL